MIPSFHVSGVARSSFKAMSHKTISRTFKWSNTELTTNSDPTLTGSPAWRIHVSRPSLRTSNATIVSEEQHNSRTLKANFRPNGVNLSIVRPRKMGSRPGGLDSSRCQGMQCFGRTCTLTGPDILGCGMRVCLLGTGPRSGSTSSQGVMLHIHRSLRPPRPPFVQCNKLTFSNMAFHK